MVKISGFGQKHLVDKIFFKSLKAFAKHISGQMTIQLWRTKNFIYLNIII